MAFLVAGLLLAVTMGVKYYGFQPLLVILISIPLYFAMVKSKSPSKREFRGSPILSVKLILSVVPALASSILFIAYLGGAFMPNLGGNQNFISQINTGLSALIKVA